MWNKILASALLLISASSINVYATSATAAASAAAPTALDLSFGHSSGAAESALISIQIGEKETKIRAAIHEGNAVCTRWRKDLCGVEDKVSHIDIVTASENCGIQNDLVTCYINSFNKSTANVVLNDGTIIPIEQQQTHLSIGSKTVLEKDFAGSGNFRTVTYITLSLEVWGNRADGLDPVVQIRDGDGFMGTDLRLQKVTKSLFP